MLRLDQHFSAADTAYLRFSFDAAYSDVPSDGLNDRQLITSRPVNGEHETPYEIQFALRLEF